MDRAKKCMRGCFLLPVACGLILASCAASEEWTTESVASGTELSEPAPEPEPEQRVTEGVITEDTVYNTEEYDRIYENPFLSVVDNPLSTFSIDVDTASYSNSRRFLRDNTLPPPDAVRIEEFVNYFSYDYRNPVGEHPFAFVTELSACPWAPDNLLLHVGIQGRKIALEKLPPNNLVFLLDVSGSMNNADKLPLLKSALSLLVEEMREQDRIAIVVYAGAAGQVLEPTPGHEKQKILKALERLEAGGSTAGGEGIRLAYEVAKQSSSPDANNRVILATDGDFNVGPSSKGALERLIERKRRDGIFLTVLGFGSGNYSDARMETLADKGNGNYAYIDSILEAKKVLVQEMGGTLLTIASDVKIQIEFNPTKVESYRLIGYENRLLRAEDFADDRKDAGELGAGHTVTALYQLIPATGESGQESELRYQESHTKEGAEVSKELMLLKFRYKTPGRDQSTLIEQPVAYDVLPTDQTTDSFRFSAAVAEFALLLRNSEYLGDGSFEQVLSLATGSRGHDNSGYRAEFVELAKIAARLTGQ